MTMVIVGGFAEILSHELQSTYEESYHRGSELRKRVSSHD